MTRFALLWCLLMHSHRRYGGGSPSRKCNQCKSYFRVGRAPIRYRNAK